MAEDAAGDRAAVELAEVVGVEGEVEVEVEVEGEARAAVLVVVRDGAEAAVRGAVQGAAERRAVGSEDYRVARGDHCDVGFRVERELVRGELVRGERHRCEGGARLWVVE